MNFKPNFFIVGAPRCGTTAMYEYLKVHPQIFMPSYKEPHYFSTDLTPSTPWMRDLRKKQNYLKLFKHVRGEKVIGEASVFYLYSKNAAKNIKKFAPNAKIVIMLRSPVEIIYSLYYQRLHGLQENASTFKEALALEKERKQGKKIPPKTLDMQETYYYKELAKLGRQVKRYYKFFNKDQIHIVIFEDIKKDVSKEYYRILEFLGVDLDFKPSFKMVNSSGATRVKILQDLLTQSAMIRRIYKRYYLSLKPMSNWVQKLNTRKVNRSSINPGLEKQLKMELLPEMRELSKIVGRDVTHWCQDNR